MDKKKRLEEFSSFLKSRRSRISPKQVGLPEGVRRRTPGLRREEVAQLAGIGVTWYTWIEQGRDVQVSVQVLEGIARALKLNLDERKHLFLLANQPPPPDSISHQEMVDSLLIQALERFGANPAYITGQRWDLLAWNQAACAVFGDFEALPIQERNILWFVFMNENLRQILVDWESHARLVLAQFRISYSRFVGDPWFVELIHNLEVVSPEFRLWWAEQNILGRTDGRKEINHPLVGQLRLNYVVFKVADNPNLEVVMYLPLPESDTALKLQQLSAMHS
ncbi:helix-turn-helix transcriptional regulator [Vacuolonema iberomarrocanum]|uniref:helix-turn-helix transcriptional regulator n=1 Tax=Vacuolonema iberomarrocanum TaxID=3454632 RepID=UPI0019F7276C|nr:helix-turn-helix domain-containing protein [filamentous cyanobacterium LEGE 07170]